MDAKTARKIVGDSSPTELFDGEYREALEAVITAQREFECAYGNSTCGQDDHDLMLCAAAFVVGRAVGVRDERKRRRIAKEKHEASCMAL